MANGYVQMQALRNTQVGQRTQPPTPIGSTSRVGGRDHGPFGTGAQSGSPFGKPTLAVMNFLAGAHQAHNAGKTFVAAGDIQQMPRF